MNWFTGDPWTTDSRNPDQPYEHPNFRRLLADMGHSERSLNLAIQDDDNARRWTERLATEVHTAWEEVRRLRDTTNVNIITTHLTDYDADRLRRVINESWQEVTRPAQDPTPTTLSGSEISEVDFRVIINMIIGTGDGAALPASRHSEVDRYFQLFDSDNVSKFNDGVSTCAFVDIDKQLPDTDFLETRKTFLLAFLNQQDLSNPEILRCLILNRVLKHPRTFARADWESCQLARASRVGLLFYRDNCFMGFPTEQQLSLAAADSGRSSTYENYAMVFREPTAADTQSPMFLRLRQSGLLFGWGEGATVLLIQAITLRLIRVIMERLAEEWALVKLEKMDLSDRLPSLKAHNWEAVPADRLVFDARCTGLVNRAQFCPPSAASSTWDDEFTHLLRDQSNKAKEHLRKLWHDPFYFQEQVVAQFHQHYGHIQAGGKVQGAAEGENSFMTHPDSQLPHFNSTDIDAKKALATDLIRRVVRWAVFQCEAWDCLAQKLSDLRNVAQEHQVKLDEGDERPELSGAVRDAWIDLGFHARLLTERHIHHVVLHGGYCAAERIRNEAARWLSGNDYPKREGGDGWSLPDSFMTWHVWLRYNDIFEGRTKKDQVQAKEQWWSMRTFRLGIADCYDSRACLGMSKLVQLIHTDIHQRHQSLGIQPMVSEDYNSVIIAGLLSQRMESIHPIRDDLAEGGTIANLKSKSHIWTFFDDFDALRFEDNIKEDTLRLVLWVLGVTYLPYSTHTLTRPSGLVQQWLNRFWSEVSSWIEGHCKSNKENTSEGKVDDRPNFSTNNWAKGRKKDGTPTTLGDNGVTKARAPRTRSVVRHFQELLGSLMYPRSNTFQVEKICGDITNLAPEGHQEPTTEYQPKPGTRRMARTKAGDVREKTLRLARDQDRRPDDPAGFIDSLMLRNRPDNIIKRGDWRTMKILFGAERGSFTDDDFFSLCRSLGLRVDPGRQGSRTEIAMTERSLFWAATGRRKIAVHAAHSTVDKVNGNRSKNFRRDLEEGFGITLEKVEELYMCQGEQ